MLLIGVALFSTTLKRLPLTTALLYLGVGVVLGPMALGMIRLDPLAAFAVIERACELTLIVSLFTAGLKLRAPLTDPRWILPVRLASLSMVLTIAAITVVGVWGLDLPLGAAVLLGAILAPTDPVLASDVQLEHPLDRDRLRFALTGEAGLNDGAAFLFVMLGLGLLGMHDLGAFGWRWLAVDLLWATAGGLAIGALLGTFIGKLVLYLRQEHKEAVGLDDFLSIGLLCLAYGTAVLLHTYGFLAAFAAGLALRQIEARSSGEPPPAETIRAAALSGSSDEIATAPAKAPAYMAQAVLGFNQQLERVLEVAAVVLLGGMITVTYLAWDGIWFVPLLLLVIRPLAVVAGTWRARVTDIQRGLISWFGIRGIGSIYYLMYAIGQGLDSELARRLTAITFTTVAASIVAHGISVTPLMKAYERSVRPGERRASSPASPSSS